MMKCLSTALRIWELPKNQNKNSNIEIENNIGHLEEVHGKCTLSTHYYDLKNYLHLNRLIVNSISWFNFENPLVELNCNYFLFEVTFKA